jgi:hypothetical protein
MLSISDRSRRCRRPLSPRRGAEIDRVVAGLLPGQRRCVSSLRLKLSEKVRLKLLKWSTDRDRDGVATHFAGHRRPGVPSAALEQLILKLYVCRARSGVGTTAEWLAVDARGPIDDFIALVVYVYVQCSELAFLGH